MRKNDAFKMKNSYFFVVEWKHTVISGYCGFIIKITTNWEWLIWKYENFKKKTEVDILFLLCNSKQYFSDRNYL